MVLLLLPYILHLPYSHRAAAAYEAEREHPIKYLGLLMGETQKPASRAAARETRLTSQWSMSRITALHV